MQPDETREGSVPESPVSPPTQPGVMMTVRAVPASKWPMVIGIIAIAVGGLGFLTNACGLLGGVMMSVVFTKMPAASMPPNMPSELWHMPPEALVVLAVRGVLSVFLLAVGIGLVQRRAWSARAVRFWAIVAIVIGVVGAVIDYRVQERNMGLMANNPGMSPLPQAFGQVMGLVVLAAYSVFRLGWPVYLLIWFGRQRIKDDVAGWRDAVPPGA